MADEKDVEFVDIGMATCWDSKDGKVKRRDKNGKAWSGGMGTVTIAGVTRKVWVTVREGARAGSQNVGLALVVDKPKASST